MHLYHGGVCLHGIWLMQTLFIVSYAIASVTYGLFVRRVPMETKHYLRIWAIFCVIFFSLTYVTMFDRAVGSVGNDNASVVGINQAVAVGRDKTEEIGRSGQQRDDAVRRHGVVWQIGK